MSIKANFIIFNILNVTNESILYQIENLGGKINSFLNLKGLIKIYGNSVVF
jgi:hypothetical protein